MQPATYSLEHLLEDNLNLHGNFLLKLLKLNQLSHFRQQ